MTNTIKLTALKATKIFTADQLAARLAAGAAERIRRAEMRAKVGVEMHLGGSDYRVIAEANRRLYRDEDLARHGAVAIGASDAKRGPIPAWVRR